LREEPSYFEAGLKKLQITQQNSIYYDSIPSFVRSLKEGPPEALHDIPDRLVAAGLHLPETFDRYKQHHDAKLDREKMQHRLTEAMERLESTQLQQGDLRQQLARERKASLSALPTNRSSEVEQQINANQTRIETMKARVGNLKKQLADLDGAIPDPKLQEIHSLRDEVCDRVVSVFSKHVADRNAQL
jgi:hypothetical protein